MRHRFPSVPHRRVRVEELVHSKKISRKLHDDGWKNGYFTSADVAKLSNGCVVSQFPQLYDQQLEKYQYLTCPYLGSSEGDNREKNEGKMIIRLGRRS